MKKTARTGKKPRNNLRKNSQLDEETRKMVANPILKELGRIVAGAYYDHQQVRITEMHRVRDIIRKKIEGIKAGEVEKKKDKSEKFQNKFKDREIPKYLNQLIMEGELTEKERDYITRVLKVHKDAEKHEEEYKKLMMEFVENEPIYTEFLQHIIGISAVLSSNLIKEFGYCENAPYISSLWKYCGMHVVDGEAPKRKRGKQLDFNLRLRALCWKIADSFIKQRTPFYRGIYDKEKARQNELLESALGKMSDEEKKEFEKIKGKGTEEKKRKFMDKFDKKAPLSKKHAEMRARRKMVKIFLAHYWQASKELSQVVEETQVNIAKPYVQAKLKHKHISNWREAVEINKLEKLRRKKIQKDKIKAD